MATLKQKAAGALRGAKNALKGARSTVRNIAAARQGDKQSRSNIYNLAVNKAKKEYKTATGSDMTASRLKADLEGGALPKATQTYISSRDSYNKDLLKKYKL